MTLPLHGTIKMHSVHKNGEMSNEKPRTTGKSEAKKYRLCLSVRVGFDFVCSHHIIEHNQDAQCLISRYDVQREPVNNRQM